MACGGRPDRHGDVLMDVLEFRQKYQDLSALQIASGFLKEYRTSLLLVPNEEGNIELVVRDKDGDGEWHSLTDDIFEMRTLAKLFSQGITFKYLLLKQVIIPKDKETKEQEK